MTIHVLSLIIVIPQTYCQIKVSASTLWLVCLVKTYNGPSDVKYVLSGFRSILNWLVWHEQSSIFSHSSARHNKEFIKKVNTKDHDMTRSNNGRAVNFIFVNYDTKLLTSHKTESGSHGCKQTRGRPCCPKFSCRGHWQKINKSSSPKGAGLLMFYSASRGWSLGCIQGWSTLFTCVISQNFKRQGAEACGILDLISIKTGWHFVRLDQKWSLWSEEW